MNFPAQAMLLPHFLTAFRLRRGPDEKSATLGVARRRFGLEHRLEFAAVQVRPQPVFKQVNDTRTGNRRSDREIRGRGLPSGAPLR
jgi:hypothetical protein